MSNTARWVLAILLIVFGIVAGVSAVFGGAFTTVGCVKTPPDWVYYVLLGAGLITLAGGVVPAVMLLRRVTGVRILIILVLGLVFSCGGYAAYMAALTKYC